MISKRLELAGESVRSVLEVLAVTAPDWLRTVIDLGEWGTRYRRRVDSWRLPTSATKRERLAGAYGADALTLPRAVYSPEAPGWLAELSAVEVPRTVIIQNYLVTTDRQGREVIRRREADTDGLPPGRARVRSPYDPDARWAAKGHDLRWAGYKVHLTETCDTPHSDRERDTHDRRASPCPPAAELNVITNVATTHAAVPDSAMTTPIHHGLASRGLLPAEHYVDSGYPSVALVGQSRHRFAVELVSPLLADTSHQAKAGAGFDRASFHLDFDHQRATCPQGQTSSWWHPATQRGTNAIVIKFSAATCRACPVRDSRTRSTRSGRQLTVPPPELHQAQTAARAEQNTTDWQSRYAIRAGVEGTIHQAVAATRIRHARYRGLGKTHLQHVFSAVALNIIRLDAWWNDHPLDRTRTSHLARLESALTA